MKISFLAFAFLIQFSINVTGNPRAEKKSPVHYNAFITTPNRIYAIRDSSTLVIWDLKTHHKVHFRNTDTSIHFISIAKDKQGQIYLGSLQGKIYRLNAIELKLTFVTEIKYIPAFILFNSSNKMLVITSAGVYDPKTNEIWDKFKNHIGEIFESKVCFKLPDYVFIDSKDYIWMTQNDGEFGGELEIFDSKNSKIVDNDFHCEWLEPDAFYAQSVFEDTIGNIYISTGLQNGVNWGAVFRIDKNRKVDTILNLSMYMFKEKKNIGTFIGPAFYNKTDNCFYFEADTSNYEKGVYKSSFSGNGKVNKPELLFKTGNYSSSIEKIMGEEFQVINETEVLKISFTNDNRLIFLTDNDGLGIWDGINLTMLR